MDTEGEAELLRRFAEKPPPGWRFIQSDAESGRFVATDGERLYYITVPAEEAARLVREGPELAEHLWPGVAGLEAAARILSIHLQESLDARDSRPGAEWTYRAGFFHPPAEDLLLE